MFQIVSSDSKYQYRLNLCLMMCDFVNLITRVQNAKMFFDDVVSFTNC